MEGGIYKWKKKKSYLDLSPSDLKALGVEKKREKKFF